VYSVVVWPRSTIASDNEATLINLSFWQFQPASRLHTWDKAGEQTISVYNELVLMVKAVIITQFTI
jgi:hypothetical protein